MLALLSPAKKLDFERDFAYRAAGGSPAPRSTTPQLWDDTRALIAVAKGLDAADLKRLMKLSDNLAQLNVERFAAMPEAPRADGARPAAIAFDGDTYVGLDAKSLDKDALTWAQQHVGILSGLYGVLRPLDVIQPYRLEMGTKLATERGKDLYAFWDDRVAKRINAMTRGHADRTVVNLASTEYFKVVKRDALDSPVLTCTFKELRDGKAKVISFLAKRARGMMARYMVDTRAEQVSALRGFDYGGYAFDEGASSDDELVFTRAS
ncbi:MAG: peroxide stress protein YaaA [Myxococcales bacterium]|nr:peroxide stress protein YaaA [Myxococcales bacterium]